MSTQVNPTPTNLNESERARSGLGLFFLWLMMFLLIGGIGVIYFQLTQANVALTKQVTALQQQTQTRVNELQVLTQAVQHLEQMSTQDIRTTILNRWYVTEAQYLARLAKNYILFMHNLPAALVLLQQADQTLQNVHDGSVDTIRRQLNQYIATLSGLPTIDITTLYSQVDAVKDQIDKLPLPFSPLQQEKSTAQPVEDITLPWWKKGLDRTMAALKEIVIVRYNSAGAVPLVTPEEKNFLRQNLHAELENVTWAVLHHNDTVYQTSLTRAINWIQQYFVQQDPTTISVLQALHNLKATNIESQSIDMAAVMQQFDEYLKA